MKNETSVQSEKMLLGKIDAQKIIESLCAQASQPRPEAITETAKELVEAVLYVYSMTRP